VGRRRLFLAVLTVVSIASLIDGCAASGAESGLAQRTGAGGSAPVCGSIAVLTV